MTKCPCKDCQDRTVTCHSVCERYEEFKKKRELENAYNRERDKDVISSCGLRRYWRGISRKKR